MKVQMTFVMVAMLASGLAVAKEKKGNLEVKKAENAMMTACQKEYPTEVKGKTFHDIAEWVETEERGTNKDTFKKSNCYNLHENWEKVAGREEEGEHHD